MRVRSFAKNVQGVLDATMKKSIKKNKTTALLQVIKQGYLYGDAGVPALDDMFVTIGEKKFPAWKILREVDLDGGRGFNQFWNSGCAQKYREPQEILMWDVH